MYQQNLELNKQLNEIKEINKRFEQYQKIEQEAREEERLRKQKRREANKLPQRDAITIDEFFELQKIAEATFDDKIVRARTILALTILYLTGLRISNLLLMTKRHVQELMTKGETTLPLIKGGSKQHLLCIGAKGKELLLKIQEQIEILVDKQPKDNGPIFFKQTNMNEPLDRVNFNKQCNKVCVIASKKLEKHIRTHSFRATIITDLLNQEVPIEKAKDLIGHADIGTMAEYRRTKIGIKETRRIMGQVQRARFELTNQPPHESITSK